MRLLWLPILLLAPVIQAAVLAIDYGAEFTKLSLVKPGVPFDVILDRDSKRKIQSVVGWKREDRVFGAEGKMSSTRFPETHFPYVKPLLGAHSLPPSFASLYPNMPTIESSAEGTIYFSHPSSPSHISPEPSSPQQAWTPTSLLAHQISYYRGLAESLAGGSEPINQAIVTVPAWWSASQRKAYRDALELQGISCLSMIGEGTAIGLNYAMTRDFPTFNSTTGEGEKEYHIIYDSGAMSTTASVVAFYQTSWLPTPKSKTAINTTHIELVGTGWQEVGGVMLDLTIQEVLVSDFIQKTGKTAVREDKRAMAKLLKEAVRVKHILSANHESGVNIESLYKDIDYKAKFSRAELESIISDAQSAFSSPITSALEAAGLNLDQITSLILHGGNTRVPFVQSAIKSVLGNDDKIAQNVNADEGAVLGAAYYGAALSRQFKMKKLEVKESSIRDIRYYSENETGATKTLFPRGTALGTKKTLSFPATGDFTLQFEEAGTGPALSVSLLDVQAALANFTSPEPTINLTLRLDTRGHLATSNAVLYSNVPESESGGVAGALKGLFGKKDKVESTDETETEEGAEVESNKTAKATSSKKEKVAIKFKEKILGVKAMTGEEKRNTQARLKSISSFESAKHAREEARNVLEGYLYRLQGLLADDAENTAVHDFAKKDEKAKLKQSVAETFDWLQDNAEKADEATLRQKRQALFDVEQPIIFRYTERQTRGKAVDDFQQAMLSARAFFVEAHKNQTLALEAQEASTPENPVAPPKFTEDELKVVEVMMKDNEKWMDPLMEVQVKLDKEADHTQDPVILTKDLNERGKTLQTTVLRLINKKAPRAPKAVKPSSSSTTTSSTESATQETETGTETRTGEKETETEPASPPVHEEL